MGSAPRATRRGHTPVTLMGWALIISLCFSRVVFVPARSPDCSHPQITLEGGGVAGMPMPFQLATPRQVSQCALMLCTATPLSSPTSPLSPPPALPGLGFCSSPSCFA